MVVYSRFGLSPRRRTYARRLVRRPRYRRGYLKNTGGITKSHMSSCLAVYHNPFSTATTNPKIPDGKVYASTGIRLQAVGEMVNDATDNMDILLFPGLQNGLITASSLSTNSNCTVYPYKDHGRFDGTIPLNQTGQAMTKWRLVSQALKITLINNSDENDGWFECIRCQGHSQSGFDLVGVSGGNGGDEVIGSANPIQIPAISSTNLVEHPTYVTGKLRDIHRYLFHLMPQGNDHEFTNIERDYDSNAEAVKASLQSEAYDMVFIRVHGRTGASPTRLMLHVVSNQEVVWDESSSNTRFHSESRGNRASFERSKRNRQENAENHRAAKKPKTQLIQSAVG